MSAFRAGGAFFALKTGHDAMVLVPEELAAILLQSA